MPPSRKAVEAQIAAFNVHFPNIKVEPQIVPWADYWTKLQTAVAGGEAFDVFWINSASCPVYASKGALVPIDDLIGDGGIDRASSRRRWSRCTPTRTFSTACRAISTRSPSSTTRTFSTPPGSTTRTDTWTWDDFRAVAEKLTDKDKGIWGAGMQTSWQENYYNFIWQNEGRLLNDDRTVRWSMSPPPARRSNT